MQGFNIVVCLQSGHGFFAKDMWSKDRLLYIKKKIVIPPYAHYIDGFPL